MGLRKKKKEKKKKVNHFSPSQAGEHIYDE
jgi:hypothetical protein